MSLAQIFHNMDWTEIILYGVAFFSTLSYAASLLLRLPRSHAFRETAESFTVAVWLALGIRYALVEPYEIPSESMVPTLLVGDHLLVNKCIFGWHIPGISGRVAFWREPHRGDVVIFIPPIDPWQSYVKRCVALPGDVLEVKNKIVYIDGRPDDYPQAVRTSFTFPPQAVQSGPNGVWEPPGTTLKYRNRDWYGPVTVPAGCYWMMGDNRDYSYDSRFWGPVPAGNLRGEPLFRYYPFDRMGTVH